MDEFIAMVTEQLGIGVQQSRSATGNILKLVKEQLDESTFRALLERIPGAESLLDATASGAADGAGGGLMGSLTSVAGSLWGGSNSGAAGVAQALGNAGISIDKVTGFISMLVAFLKDKLGDDLFATVATNLPGLLADGDKG